MYFQQISEKLSDPITAREDQSQASLFVLSELFKSSDLFIFFRSRTDHMCSHMMDELYSEYTIHCQDIILHFQKLTDFLGAFNLIFMQVVKCKPLPLDSQSSNLPKKCPNELKFRNQIFTFSKPSQGPDSCIQADPSHAHSKEPAKCCFS